MAAASAAPETRKPRALSESMKAHHIFGARAPSRYKVDRFVPKVKGVYRKLRKSATAVDPR